MAVWRWKWAPGGTGGYICSKANKTRRMRKHVKLCVCVCVRKGCGNDLPVSEGGAFLLAPSHSQFMNN